LQRLMENSLNATVAKIAMLVARQQP